MKILNPALFFEADLYLKVFEKIWIDGVISERDWKQLMEYLKKEWSRHSTMVCLFFSCSLDSRAAGENCMIIPRPILKIS